MKKLLVVSILSALGACAHGSQLFGMRQMNTAGAVLSLTDGAGNSVSRSYNVDGSLSSSTNLLGHTLSVGYNPLGQVSYQGVLSGKISTDLPSLLKGSVVSPSYTTYTYDTHHRVSSVTYHAGPGEPLSDNSKEQYAYYPGGQVQYSSYSFMKSSGSSALTTIKTYNVHYDYDPISGAVLEKSSWLGSNSTLPTSVPKTDVNRWYYDYGVNGLQSVEYYDSTNNGVYGTDSPTFTLSYRYNAEGQVSIINRTPGYSTYNFYGTGQDAHRLVGIVIGAASSSSVIDKAYKTLSSDLASGGSIKTGKLPSSFIEGYFYQYNSVGDPIKETTVSNTSQAQGYIQLAYTYTPENMLSGYHVVSSGMSKGSKAALYPKDSFGTPLQSETFTYLANYNINTVTKTEYKGTNTANPTLTLTYHYMSDYPNRLERISASSSTGYPYESEMAYLNDKDYVYNAAGSVKSDPEGDTYTYDNHNQLIKLVSPSAVQVVYGYGANGLENYEQSTLSSNTHDPMNGIAVYHYGGVETQGDLTRIDAFPGLMSDTETQNKTTDHVSSNLTDLYEVGQSNVALTSEGSPSESQAINNEYVYGPYGVESNVYKPVQITESTNSTYDSLLNQTRKTLDISKNQVGYTGQSLDPSTGLMMLGGFRNYAPGIGRFIQPDTYNAFTKHSITNPYAYVLDNPMFYTDPTGHFSWKDFGEALASVIVNIPFAIITAGQVTVNDHFNGVNITAKDNGLGDAVYQGLIGSDLGLEMTHPVSMAASNAAESGRMSYHRHGDKDIAKSVGSSLAGSVPVGGGFVSDAINNNWTASALGSASGSAVAQVAMLLAFKDSDLDVGMVAWRESLEPDIGDEEMTEMDPCPLAFNMKIQTKDGEKFLSDIRVGDEVLSVPDTQLAENEDTTPSYQKVTSIYKGKMTEAITLALRDANDELNTMTLSPGKQFYVEGKGYKQLKDLKAGDTLVNQDKEPLVVAKVEQGYTGYNPTEELPEGYAINVALNHTFFAGDQSVLMHNGCPKVRALKMRFANEQANLLSNKELLEKYFGLDQVTRFEFAQQRTADQIGGMIDMNQLQEYLNDSVGYYKTLQEFNQSYIELNSTLRSANEYSIEEKYKTSKVQVKREMDQILDSFHPMRFLERIHEPVSGVVQNKKNWLSKLWLR